MFSVDPIQPNYMNLRLLDFQKTFIELYELLKKYET
jgi:hypothetical protein